MKHILMVDNVTANLESVSEVLGDDYELSAVRSGEEALLFLVHTRPDLILLDTNMPEMNGYELLEKIKEEPEYTQIPIIFLTSDSDGKSEARGLRMGAMDFIRKPIEPEIMKSRIDKILQIDETRRELELRARRDSLTELWNRKYMEELIDRKFHRRKDMCGAFLLLDMDNFKGVNDTFGHIMGDAVLVRFAHILQEFSGSEDSLCRIGGDEFAFFLEGLHGEEEIKETARKIIATIEYHLNDILDDSTNLRVSASIGISCMPEDGMDFYTLYNKADKALYYVKQNGRRGYHLYQEKEGDSASHADEDTMIDLLQLQMVIQENCRESGAYQVEYDGFKKIYRFVARCMERSGQQVQIVLFTVEGSGKIPRGELEAAVFELEHAVRGSLRRGDVSTQYSMSQYVAILMDASTDNGKMVAERVSSNWRKLVDNPALTLRYDIREVTPGKNKDME